MIDEEIFVIEMALRGFLEYLKVQPLNLEILCDKKLTF